MSKNVSITGFKRSSKESLPTVRLERNAEVKTTIKVESKVSTPDPIDYSYPEEEQDDNYIPETINITYKNDVNIVIIHNAIRERFSIERGKLNEYRQQLHAISDMSGYTLTPNETRTLFKERAVLLAKIDEIKTGSKWEDYVVKAKPLLERYQVLGGQKNRRVVLIGKRVEKEEEKVNNNLRLEIIQAYLPLASNYITINASRIEKLMATCPICNTGFDDFEIDEDMGTCTCTNCGWYRDNLAKISCNKDSTRTSSNNKNDYEDRENFYKTAIRFACKQSKTFHVKLEEDLDEHFSRNGIPSGEEVRSQPLIKGRKKGVNFQMMVKALTTLSKPIKPELAYRSVYSDYYEDIWLIMHTYWGFDAHDIMPLIPRLMEIYDDTQDVYNSMTLVERGGRDASPNTQFRLLVELLAVGYPCTKADFKLQIQQDSLENHQRVWKIMCYRAGLPELFHEII